MQLHNVGTVNNILMISLHGYVAAEPELGKPDTGGQVVYVLELTKRFSRLGRKVDLVTRRFEDQEDTDVINDNLRVWRIPFSGKRFIRKEDMHDHIGDFVTNMLSAIHMAGIQYDVIYTHYWDAGWAGQKIAEELGIPHVHTPHSLGLWKEENMGSDMSKDEMETKYRFKERVQKEYLVYQMSDFIIATTEPQAEQLRDSYDVLDDRMTVIPPGMDENRYSPIHEQQRTMLREQYGFRPHDILTLGRMAHNKGYDLLIDALPTVLELVPDARLLAAIGGEDSAQDDRGVDTLKEQAQKLGIADKIEWLGYVPDEELADYYRAAGVFSMSSRYEPFGMVAIEAMAVGTPTVITVHGGLMELLNFGRHGLYADPTRAVEYGTMLAFPLLYPDLAHLLSVEGARFARRNFGWTGIAKRHLNVFSEVRQHTARYA